MLAVGRRAPDFQLAATGPETVRLSALRGWPVVLVFYPADWSRVCGDQLALYQAAKPVFDTHDARLLGISVDGRWCHRAYAEQHGIEFPLLADFEPKGDVARLYGVYDERAGTAQRALFVLDREGSISWNHLSPPDVNPGADGILAALEAM